MADRKGIFLWYGYSEQFRLLTDPQLGKLIRSLLEYSQNGEAPVFEDPVLQIAFSFLAASDAREQERYAEICEERRSAGKKGGRPKKANGFSENQMVSSKSKKSKCFSENLILNQELNIIQDPVINQDLIQESTGAAAPTPAGDNAKRKFGAFGWVRLTSEEYTRLLDELGETELERCITYVDESAQSNGNKNKWKDWNLVIRKCSRDRWGLRQQGGGQCQSASISAMDDLQQLHQMYANEEYQ